MRLKPIVLLAAVTAIAGACQSSAVKPAITPDKKLEAKVEATLKRLTLEEKIGQMTQLNGDFLFDRENNLKPIGDSALRVYKIGSVLNNLGTGRAMVPEEFRKAIKILQDISLETTGIPCLYGLDQIHGASYTKGATLFPQEINLAASFNEELPRQMGEILAYETRACNIPWTFSPVMDLGRNPIWPRVWESFGEDVLLNSRMAVSETIGIQGNDPNNIDTYHLAACIKHYMAYGAPVSGQDRTPSSITHKDLRENYFQPFRKCIEAGALTLMVNSSVNDGIPFHANYEMLTEWLKEGLNWDGMIVTDWADINNLWNRDHFAKDKKDAVRLAINAGIDMAMVPSELQFCTYLKELVEEGKVKMSRIDDAVRRILRLKYRLGLFDDPYLDNVKFDKFASEDFARIAYNAAVESQVLLKNDNDILPLKKSTRILVTGPNANSMRTLNGGWSYTWQGDGADLPEYTEQYNTILEALQNKFDNVKYVPGVRYEGWNWKHDVADIRPAVAAAAGVDVIIACIGENSYCETPGNDETLALSENQTALIKALAATGKPVILVLNEGRTRIIREIEPLAKAVVDIMLPGNYGGDALAALLCGEENFSAKLPFTYQKYVGKYATYDYKLSENQAVMAGIYNYDAKMDVQWRFGDGLSYTSYEYSDISVNKSEFKAGDVLEISVNIKNVGKLAGKEPVLLFCSDLYASNVPEVKRLRDFTKIALQPSESKTVKLSVRAEDLAFVDSRNGKWTLEEGAFRFAVGTESIEVNCTETKVWEEANI